jgi:hypothetical protein
MNLKNILIVFVFIFFALPTVSALADDSGLVGRWAFDELGDA